MNNYKQKTRFGLTLIGAFILIALRAQTIQLGTGVSTSGNTTASPVNGYYEYMRYQTVYTAAEINAQGIFGPIAITNMAYYLISVPDSVLKNYEVRMANTLAVNCAAHVADPLTTVYFNAAPSWTANTWNTLTLSTPFMWDGTSNLVIDVNFGRVVYASGGTYGALRTYALTNGSRYVRCDSSGTCGSQANITTNTTQNTKPQIQLTFLPAAICSGTPVAGTASAPASVCSTIGFDLTLTGQTPDGGITVQWQSSSDGINFSDISGATFPISPVSQTSDTYYHCVVTCTGSGLSDTSNVVLVTMSPFLTCYCASGASNSTDTKIDSVRFLTVSTGSPLTTCQTYTDYTSLVAAAQQTVPFFLNIKNGFCVTTHYPAYVSVYIDYNHNGILDDAGELVYSFGPTTARNTIPPVQITIPGTSQLGQTRMRIILAEGTAIRTPCEAYTYGETEDYTIDISAAPVCSSPSAGGAATGPSVADVGPAYLYELTGFNGNIQWQYSTASAVGPFINITGAYNDSLSATFNAVGTYWIRAFVTEPGCDPDSSNAVQTVVQLLGDDVCDAITLSFGVNGPFSTEAATVQSGEPAPSPGTATNSCQSQDGWCAGDTTVTNSRWFKFVAPASGRVSIQSPGFDTQLALWDATTCGDLLTGGATLVRANDDDPDYTAHGGVIYSSFIDSAVCLTPGKTYYVQLDPYTSPGDFTTIVLTDLGGISVSVLSTTDVSCYGDTDGAIDVEVTGASGSYAFEWNNMETTEDISGLAPGTYVLTVTDAGCEATVSSGGITIYEPAPLTAMSDSIVNVRCMGESTGGVYISVSGGTTPYNFDWSNGSANEDLTGVPAGTYSGTLTDANGCSISSPPFPITEPSTIVSVMVDAVTDNLCPGGSTGGVEITASGGTPGYSYSWSNGSMDEDITGVGADDYDVVVTDANGCIASASATVSEPAPVAVTVDSIHHVSCFGGNTGAVYITVSGGTSPYMALWSNSSTDEDITGLIAGNYFTTVTDDNGCTGSGMATVNEATAITVLLDSVKNNLCSGSTSAGIYISVGGGNGGYVYSWSNGATSQDNAGIAQGSYTLNITDAAGCPKSFGPVSTLDPPAIAASSVSTNQVQGGAMGSVNLTVSGGTPGYNFLWNNGATTEDLASVPAGSYCVTITDANSCSFSICDSVSFITGISSAENIAAVNLYPNPAQDKVFLELVIGNVSDITVEVYNVNAQLITGFQRNQVSDAKFEINFADEAAGVYYARIKAGNTLLVKRILVAR